MRPLLSCLHLDAATALLPTPALMISCLDRLPFPPPLAGRAERDGRWRCKANEPLGRRSRRPHRFRQGACACTCLRAWCKRCGCEGWPSKPALLQRSSKASTLRRGGRRPEAADGARRLRRRGTPYGPAPLPPPYQPKRHDTEEEREVRTGGDEAAGAGGPTSLAPTTTRRSTHKTRRRSTHKTTRRRPSCQTFWE
jgi:hypothetical protein